MFSYYPGLEMYILLTFSMSTSTIYGSQVLGSSKTYFSTAGKFGHGQIVRWWKIMFSYSPALGPYLFFTSSMSTSIIYTSQVLGSRRTYFTNAGRFRHGQTYRRWKNIFYWIPELETHILLTFSLSTLIIYRSQVLGSSRT